MHGYIYLLVPTLLICVQLLVRVVRALSSPLRDIPGPFWTRFTTLWYFNQVWKGRFERDNIRLHKQYGPVVRISPNHYSISDASAIKTVYGTSSRFAKSAWYDGWKHPAQWTVFADRDIKRHGELTLVPSTSYWTFLIPSRPAETRKRFTSLYSMSSLVHYESFVDHCAELFIRRLDDFASRRQSLNLGHWFQCYAFDVIGAITFGERFGFLDKGDDIDGTMAALHKVLRYSTLVGIYPDWHPRLSGPLSKFKLSGAGGRVYISRFVQEKIRQHEAKKLDPEASADAPIQTQDFVEKLILARDKDPEKVTDYHLFIMGQSNVTAGSDTTAISLSSIMWHLMQNPDVLGKLRAEIDQFTLQGRCSENVTFKESQEMPYLQAVMKEALRVHSATGLPMWRVVPDGGAEISGRFFPAGTVVGVNTWVAHFDERVFIDAEAFRPERWLEAENHAERLKEMNEMYMPFGLGSRTCLGKHISILEMSKLIPRLVRDYDLVPMRRTWTTENHWFVKPTDFEVHVSRRRNKPAL